jgi:hypothetical protein
MNAIETYQAFYTVLALTVRPLMVAALIGGYWLALRAAKIPSPRRQISWLIVSIGLTGWFAAIWWLGARGSLTATPSYTPPLPAGLLIPIVIGLVVLPRFRSFVRAVKAAPPWFLIGLQFYRIMGINFIILWTMGGPIPTIFALPAGIGDVMTALLAVPAAIYVARGGQEGRFVGVAWNLFGIADLVNAITLGFLTGPGQFQTLALDHPNLAATSFPTVLTPFFVVPLSIVLHGLSLWQLTQKQPAIAVQPQPA